MKSTGFSFSLFASVLVESAEPCMMTGFVKEPELITRNGKPTAVILPIKDYEALLERAEDAEDIQWLKERRKKPMSFRTLDEFLSNRV